MHAGRVAVTYVSAESIYKVNRYPLRGPGEPEPRKLSIGHRYAVYNSLNQITGNRKPTPHV